VLGTVSDNHLVAGRNVSMREFSLWLFIFVVAAMGVISLAVPERVIAFRRARHWSESWISGGILYTTKTRVRVVGVVLIGLAAFSCFVRVFGAQ
jgi:hypothetical protein